MTAINVGRDLSGTVTVNTLPKPRDPFVINFLADISSFKLASGKLFREMGEGDDAVISIARYGDLQGGICGKYLAAKYSLEADLLQQTEAAWSAFIEASDERTRHSDRDWVAKNLPAAMEIRRRYENAFDEFLRVVSDAFETQARREAR